MRNQALFEKYRQGDHWNAHSTIYAERFLKYLRLVEFSGMILDLGCGRGRDVEYFCRNGCMAFGIDLSKDNLDLAIERVSVSISLFSRQNVEDLGIASNVVEAVFMISLAHYVDEEKMLAEGYRILRKNSYFFAQFNLLIIDDDGNIDFKVDKKEILKKLSKFTLLSTREFTRHDDKPLSHTHIVLELIMQKW